MCFMQRMKVLALCVAVLLTFSGLVSAKQGFDIKASVLFGTKLDVDDVGNIGAEGTGTMEWDWKGKNAEEDPDRTVYTGYADFSLVVTGEVSEDAKKIAVSPEEEGYPILLEATYGMDKLQIGGFWLGGFKSEGETAGVVKGFDESNYADFEELLFYPIADAIGTDRPTLESLTGLDAMVFFGGEDFPVLPGMSYYFRHYSKEPGAGDSTSEEGLYILTATDIEDKKYLRAKVHRGIGEVDFDVNPDAGATEWASEVSVNLSNYGGNVGYKLFEQNNIGVTVMVGLEQLKWEEEIKNTATENYDIKFTSMDIEYGVSREDTGYNTLVENLYGSEFNASHEIKQALGLEGDEAVDATLTNFSLLQDSKLEAVRDIEVVRKLDYTPTGYSVGASIGGLVADKLRVSANFSLGWFSGDAKVKVEAKDSRTATFNELKEGVGTWSCTVGESQEEIEIPIEDTSDVWADQSNFIALANGMDGRASESSKEKKHTDTEVTLTRAQVSAEYDITDSVFLGGGFFYSQWKDMPVLSNKSALEIEKQDLVASGVNVEVGVRF